MAFITYFTQKHDTDAENAPWGAKLYFRLLYPCYFAELSYINKHIESKEAVKCMQRWGYMQTVNPSFDELVHGTSPEVASYALDMLT